MIGQPVASGTTPSNPNSPSSRASAKASTTRTELSSSTQSSRHSGKKRRLAAVSTRAEAPSPIRRHRRGVLSPTAFLHSQGQTRPRPPCAPQSWRLLTAEPCKRDDNHWPACSARRSARSSAASSCSAWSPGRGCVPPRAIGRNAPPSLAFQLLIFAPYCLSSMELAWRW